MRMTLEDEFPRWQFVAPRDAISLGREVLSRKDLTVHKDVTTRGVMLTTGSSYDTLLDYCVSLVSQFERQNAVTYIVDFANAEVLSSSSPHSVDLTYEELHSGFFDPIGAKETYCPSVILDITRLLQQSRMEAIPRLNAAPLPLSIFEVVQLFERAAQREKSAKAASVHQQLLPWVTMLGSMAYVRSAPDIEERHQTVRIDLSALPFDFARRWFCVWVYREYLKALERKQGRTLSRALIIPQGDKIFGKEFSETTGSQTFSLAKRVIALQKFGWAVIVLCEQSSELDQVVRNSCVIPICFP